MKTISDKKEMKIIFFNENEIFHFIVKEEIKKGLLNGIKPININCSYQGSFLPAETVNKLQTRFKAIKDIVIKQYKEQKKLLKNKTV